MEKERERKARGKEKERDWKEEERKKKEVGKEEKRKRNGQSMYNFNAFVGCLP